MDMSDQGPWPTELRLDKDKTTLHVVFDDGQTFDMTAEFLRVNSPSAEVQGHGPSQRKTVPGKRGVKIAKLEPVGNYAVRIDFDDGHDTGLYSWTTLWELGANREELWQRYLNELQAKDLSRDG